tara:strand:- start:5089 stop:6303 length:1215 start_codon:yes stop_codon:yes gene_type:complete
MENEKMLVPNLRFAEFEDEWKFTLLGELGELVSGLTYSPKDIHEGGILVLRSSNVQNGQLAFEDNVYVNTTEFNEVIENDILLVVRNGSKRLIGKCTLIPKEHEGLAFGAFMSIFRSDYNKFLVQWFWSEDFKKEVRKNLGATINSINGSNLKKFKLSIPTLPEQQKIANFLTSIDKQIQTLEKKKSLLEQYKKGVMQKIFKQELRFKEEDGNDFPKWEYVKLKEVLKRSKLKNTDLKVKYVLTNSATQGIVSQNDYFDKDIANKNNLQGYYIVEKDDFIYNPRISQFAPVGPLKRNKLAQGVMSPLYTVLRPKQGNLEFLEFYFETTLWHKYMKAIANYGARHDRMNITMTDFENLPIPFPSLEEQIKIANFLSAIDENIGLVNTKIEHTKAYKKGLLQRMFV